MSLVLCSILYGLETAVLLTTNLTYRVKNAVHVVAQVLQPGVVARTTPQLQVVQQPRSAEEIQQLLAIQLLQQEQTQQLQQKQQEQQQQQQAQQLQRLQQEQTQLFQQQQQEQQQQQAQQQKQQEHLQQLQTQQVQQQPSEQLQLQRSSSNQSSLLASDDSSKDVTVSVTPVTPTTTATPQQITIAPLQEVSSPHIQHSGPSLLGPLQEVS